MANDDAPAMTPAQAATILRDVDGYEERLTARANGLTSMLWGLIAAAIFLTYGTADPYLESIGAEWIYPLLWIPWVAAGITATSALWSNHAISLRKDPHTRQSVGASVAAVLLFLGITVALFLGLDRLAGVDWSTSGIMTVTNGIFAIALATGLKRLYAGCNGPATISAGIVMVAAGIAIGFCTWGPAATTLLGAAVTGSAWFTAGLYTYRRG